MTGVSGTGRSVAAKMLALIAAFETGPRARSLTELADIAGLTLPTAHRLVGELVQWGALDRVSRGRYQLGLRLWNMARHVGPPLRDTARPFLQELHSLTRETSHLAVRHGDDALHIDGLSSTRRMSRASGTGGRAPLHATAVGRVLLAYETPEVREGYLARVDRTQMADELAEIRRQGFAMTIEEDRSPACSLAVPVRHREQRVVAAIGLVTGPGRSGQAMHHLPALRGVARRIEAAVGRYPVEHLT